MSFLERVLKKKIYKYEKILFILKRDGKKAKKNIYEI